MKFTKCHALGKVEFAHGHNYSGTVKAENICANKKSFEFYRANIGNPHCIIPMEDISPLLAKEYGPIIEKDSRFGDRTNVQFMKVIDRNTIQIEIWE